MIPYTLALFYSLTSVQNNAIRQQFITIISKTLSLPNKIVDVVWKYVAGDALDILRDPKSLVTNELYNRSISTGVGVGFFSFKPVMYVFSTNKQLVMKIAEYGDRGQEDIHARDDFAIIESALRYKTVVNLTGESASKERMMLKNHISGDSILKDLMQQANEFLNNYLRNSWNENSSLQDQISYLTTNIVARNFLGIPHVPMEYIPLIQRLSALIDQGNPKSEEFKQVVAQLRDIDIQLLRESRDEIIRSGKYISDHLHIKEMDTDQTIDEKLNNIPSVSTLILQDNLTATINMAIAQIAKSEEIRSSLLDEINGIKDISQLKPEELCYLPHLHAIYCETLRFLSPTAIIVRKTSKSLSFHVNEQQEILIAPQSRLFIPIRRIHHDRRYWEHPEKFDPTRFLKCKKPDYFMPFSLGKRSCPAGGTKYAEVLFKVFIVSIFSQYELSIDQELEVIPQESTYPRWQNPYYAKIEPIPNKLQTGSFSRSPLEID
ncbi:TPA: cytochrome P450 [Legionella pneumophila]|nr:cytochrome P450 [Legionella pneumophila]HAT8181148.1 cytochrome P450 [Legionella pneumophila]